MAETGRPSLRLLGGCLARVPKSPVDTGTEAACGHTFVLNVRLTTQTPRRGGPPCPPARFEN